MEHPSLVQTEAQHLARRGKRLTAAHAVLCWRSLVAPWVLAACWRKTVYASMPDSIAEAWTPRAYRPQ
eukprot:409607-Lingulodinium_polyedra.AAC.1